MTAPDDIDLVDRLVAEYADRLARGEDPQREELLARAPQQRQELERCFRMLELAEPALAGPLAAGFELGDYRLVRVLGRGGMAVVYEAEQKSLGRHVALKVLRPHLTLEPRHFERFQREARAAAKLAHPSVVPIHAVGAADGHAFIAFELVPGPTLARVIDVLAASGKRPAAADLARASGCAALAEAPSYAAACVQLLGGVFAAVEHAHRQGVVHRDLKPSNVLLTADGKPLVADFGLAKDLGEGSLSITGETIGTPHYMAPEQANALAHLVDARTDVYALGVVLYELLTLQRPFAGRTLHELVQSIVNAPPKPPSIVAPEIPVALDGVVLKALAKEREQRYASVAELAADLARAVRGEATQAPPTRGLDALITGYWEAARRKAPFEYRSRATLFGMPWIHVVLGVRDARGHPKVAKGVFAAGDCAVGFYAAGKSAFGFVALGLLSVGFVSLGMIGLGFEVIAGLAFGWHVRGGFVAGNAGQGLISEWLAVRETGVGSSPAADSRGVMALLVSIVGAMIAVFARATWMPLARSDAEKRFVTRVTCIWMPIACVIPITLETWGVRPPLMVYILASAAVSGFFALLVRRRLGPKRAQG